ncbi:MAG: CcdB family protein [Pseudomonadota bacterium]|uniref:CcdB family protein n=1 Tax=Polaromonas sp. TaxID=1869339 RepID=UPI0017952BE2|nr:CcdB family protein [Polaromonas sp.]MBA3595643.1 CcdB family protein [Polaromonas sp.]MDQ3271479.1 CcdB family protein [Pseudomonadota bacterium]
MAQFDVYVNPQPASREFVPYVLDVQSELIDQLATRLVMPLSRVGVGAARLPLNLCLPVQIDAEDLIVLAHMAAPVPARLLKKPVASLRHRASEISAALDAVISGF